MAIGLERLFGQRRVLAHHEQLHRLASLGIGHAHGRAFQHAGMQVDHLLDLVGVHVEARHQDHVLLAVHDANLTALVHDADVAGTEEAVGRHDLRRLVVTLPVASHHLRTTDGDFATPPMGRWLPSSSRIATSVEGKG